MCCFSKPVPYVAGTKIFARGYADGRQALVYSMSFAAAEELAMILPIPVPPGSPEDAVRFVSLDGYDRFFDDVDKAFPPLMLEAARSAGFVRSAAPQAKLLKVHDVGDFEASFVPRQADFDRLDERFKLDPEVWAKLPQYADWGFAVFKLRPKAEARKGFFSRFLGSKPKRQRVHPMAFVFPRREPDILFFPTVHVHDGEVHETATFDHVLFCQPGPSMEEPHGWERSEKPLGMALKTDLAGELIDPQGYCYRHTLRSVLPNQDWELGRPPRPGAPVGGVSG